MANKESKKPTTERMLVDDEQIDQVPDNATEQVITKSNLQPGYVELALKSGKGGTVIVPKSTMKYYPEDVWVIVSENNKKK